MSFAKWRPYCLDINVFTASAHRYQLPRGPSQSKDLITSIWYRALGRIRSFHNTILWHATWYSPVKPWYKSTASPGVGVTKAPFVNFSVTANFDLSNSSLDTLNHVHIWQVSLQLSYGDTCQIWTECSIVSVCFDSAEIWGNNGTEVIGLVTPTPDLPCGFPSVFNVPHDRSVVVISYYRSFSPTQCVHIMNCFSLYLTTHVICL